MDKLDKIATVNLGLLQGKGALKGRERVAVGFIPPQGGKGPQWLLDGEGERPFLAMNSNSYLGLSLDREVIDAGEKAARKFGAGPGAVRFISGTCRTHVELEERLASFHGRESAMLFSSAYAALLGILPPLVTEKTAVFSDELNHNCIINGLRLCRPRDKRVYGHLDAEVLDRLLRESAAEADSALIVTDGVFSMRGDHAPLDRISSLVQGCSGRYRGGIVTVVDDSHGVGALGATGRGTEEVTGAGADLLAATLGKALGVNGGYVVSSGPVIDWLRETAPCYVYSNPVTPGEAAAACKALEILDSPRGRLLLERLRSLTEKLRRGITSLGFETLPGEHPIVPLLVRDTETTKRLVRHLYDGAVLAAGLGYPVVPQGEEEVRFQVSASHTEGDIELLLDLLGDFQEKEGEERR